jgi:hypothetical protein
MPKARTRPSPPPQYAGDIGPNTAAAQAGKTVTTTNQPNNERRAYRPHILDIMRSRGQLTAHQHAAGIRISYAWENTQRSPSYDLADPRVDATPDPEARTMVNVEAAYASAQIMKLVPRPCTAVVTHVCQLGRAIEDGLARTPEQQAAALNLLRRALDLVSDGPRK